MYCCSSINRRGFSLVELSIVLVILGLLVGGVLSGQSLIRAAELRAVSTEYNRYVTAVQSFRDKYFALPGDMTNAQSFWDVAHATPATCVTTASTTPATCNGNGDGIILTSTGSNEIYRFWQHLANAGLIEGQYDGITHGATAYSSTTANSPQSKLSKGLWFAYYRGTLSGNGSMFDGTYGNHFQLGGVVADQDPSGYVARPEEIWNIDTKIDDGAPYTGKVVPRYWPSCTNATTSADSAATYLLISNAVVCPIMFRQLF